MRNEKGPEATGSAHNSRQSYSLKTQVWQEGKETSSGLSHQGLLPHLCDLGQAP